MLRRTVLPHILIHIHGKTALRASTRQFLQAHLQQNFTILCRYSQIDFLYKNGPVCEAKTTPEDTKNGSQSPRIPSQAIRASDLRRRHRNRFKSGRRRNGDIHKPHTELGSWAEEACVPPERSSASPRTRPALSILPSPSASLPPPFSEEEGTRNRAGQASPSLLPA